MAQILRSQVSKGEIPKKENRLREATEDSPKDPKIAELPKSQRRPALAGHFWPVFANPGSKERVMKTKRNMSKALLFGAWPTGYKKDQHRRKAALPVAAALFLISLLPSPVSAITITTDTTLTADHFGNFTIGADGITLDCAGFSVIGSGAGTGIRVSGRRKVTVKNCVVTDFSRGFLSPSDKVHSHVQVAVCWTRPTSVSPPN